MAKLEVSEKDWFLETISSPSKWSEHFLKDPTDPNKSLVLRSYQREFLDASPTQKHMVIRWGRRLGKCSSENDTVILSNGSIITVKELYKRYSLGQTLSIITMSDDLKFVESQPIKICDNGVKDTFKVKTRSGRLITVTSNHPLLTINGWTIVEDLKVGDQIVVPSKIEINSNYEIEDYKIKLLAYLLADGCITQKTVSFTNIDQKIINEFSDCCLNFNGIRIRKAGFSYYASHKPGKKNPVRKFLDDLGLKNEGSHDKYVPDIINTLSRRQQALFLSRLYACDGWVSVGKSKRKSGQLEIGYCSVSKKLIYGVSNILIRFGIKHYIRKRYIKYKGTLKIAYSLDIHSKEDIINFIDKIGVFSKEDQCLKIINGTNKQIDTKNGYFYQLPKEILKIFSIKTSRKIRKIYNPSKDKILKYAHTVNNTKLIELCNSDTYFDEIVSITKMGKIQTYAIEVPDTHNYISNNILVHNSVSLCADALWHVCAYPLLKMYHTSGDTQAPIKVLILTPMDTQIKMLFDTLLQLCADSPFMEGMILKVKRSDVSEIIFNNGSIIKGMTIGISSANKGLSARGQNADYLLLDEADYIPSDVYEQSIQPISSTNLECKIRMCSTPSGKRSFFFNYCNKSSDLGWWARHYPSWHPDNPNWISILQAQEQGLPLHMSTEYQFRSTMDQASYMREFGAEFGEENQGVYKHTFINKSLTNYCKSYDIRDIDIFSPGFSQTPGNIYIMGVDWNTYINGGQVVVIEYCKEPTYIEYFDDNNNKDVKIDCTGKFRIFYRRGIKSEESTQRETRQEILRLMQTYRIDHVYVDYGAGDTNIEELTLYGKQNPGLLMHSKLHVVDAGSNIEHYDPVMQKYVAKRAKSMIVSNSVNFLEQGMILLPQEEDSKHRLVDQMRNYTVKTVTVRGDFTYEGEDHILDAYCLALHGFQMQYTILLASRYENKIKFMENPRLNLLPSRQKVVNTNIFNKNIVPTRDPEKTPQFSTPRFSPMRSGRSGSLGTSFRKTF